MVQRNMVHRIDAFEVVVDRVPVRPVVGEGPATVLVDVDSRSYVEPRLLQPKGLPPNACAKFNHSEFLIGQVRLPLSTCAGADPRRVQSRGGTSRGAVHGRARPVPCTAAKNSGQAEVHSEPLVMIAASDESIVVNVTTLPSLLRAEDGATKPKAMTSLLGSI